MSTTQTSSQGSVPTKATEKGCLFTHDDHEYIVDSCAALHMM